MNTKQKKEILELERKEREEEHKRLIKWKKKMYWN